MLLSDRLTRKKASPIKGVISLCDTRRARVKESLINHIYYLVYRDYAVFLSTVCPSNLLQQNPNLPVLSISEEVFYKLVIY